MDNKLEQTFLKEEFIYNFDEEYHQQLLNEKPWTKEYIKLLLL
jgi:hypothetical protein